MSRPVEITHICNPTRMAVALGRIWNQEVRGFVWVEEQVRGKSRVIHAQMLPAGARLMRAPQPEAAA